MAKVKPSPRTDSTVAAQPELGNRKKSKRKRFWAKETSETKKKAGPVLPPRGPGEYSTNWKALQQLMNQETNAKKVTESKSKIQTKEETCGVEKEPHRGMQPERGAGSKAQADCRKQNPQVARGAKPERGAGSKAQADSQTASVLLKTNGLKPDKSVNQGNQRSEKKRRISRRGPPEEDCSVREKKRTKVEPELEKPTGPDIWFDGVDPDDIEAALGPEAADVARRQIEVTMGTAKPKPTVQSLEKMLVKDGAFEGLTKAVAMDCEMVGVGPDKVDSILARVSIVNHFGKCVYDKYVKPTEKVTDYRTWVSGIRPSDVKNGEAFKVVQREVADILEGRTLVGHAVHNDLKILLLGHPKRQIRDTQKYKPFKAAVRCGRPSLKHLCQQILKVKVQESEHSSVQDAQATMRLYTLARKQWEAELKAMHKTKKKEVAKEKPNLSS